MCLQVTDYRSQFSKWWVSEWKAVAFPEKGLVFDYYVDETQVRTVLLPAVLACSDDVSTPARCVECSCLCIRLLAWLLE
jgi:hypothetical protein